MLRDVGSLDQQFQLLEAFWGKPNRDPGELTAQGPQLELLANQSLKVSSSVTVARLIWHGKGPYKCSRYV